MKNYEYCDLEELGEEILSIKDGKSFKFSFRSEEIIFHLDKRPDFLDQSKEYAFEGSFGEIYTRPNIQTLFTELLAINIIEKYGESVILIDGRELEFRLFTPGGRQ